MLPPQAPALLPAVQAVSAQQQLLRVLRASLRLLVIENPIATRAGPARPARLPRRSHGCRRVLFSASVSTQAPRMEEALPVWQGFLRFVTQPNDRHAAGAPANIELRPASQGELNPCWCVFAICPCGGNPKMKSNLVRLMFVVAVACVSLVLMESQADAFFGRFRNRGCGGHRQHWSSCNTGCASSCAPVSRCVVEQADCGCANNCGCATACDSGCGNRRHCGIFGRRHHRHGCGGCDSGCGGCNSGCGASQSGCACGGGEVIQGQVVEPAPVEGEAVPAAPEEPTEAPAEEAPADGSV